MRDERSVRRTLRDRPALAGVIGATLVALLLRFVDLGFRTAHQDEARVGLRIIEYVASGQYVYRPIVHGPFLFQVNRPLFALFGAGDAVGRFVVALVGGLLPLAAWLFRDRLRDVEVVALAGFLALNPVLLYYSRFMRNDILVAGFALVALGFGIRAVDADDHRYLYSAAAALALAFTTKENALLYVVAWVGAGVLVLDQRLRLERAEGANVGAAVERRVDAVWDRVRAWRVPIAIAAVEFVVIVAFFYAPRPALWTAVTAPTRLPGVIEASTIGAFQSMWGRWIGSGMQDHPYLPFLRHYLGVLAYGALPVVVLAVAGFVIDRYSPGRSRELVAFAGFWGVASVLGYPLVEDIEAPWNAVHAVVPLTIPAAVAVGWLYRWGRDALVADDLRRVAVAALVGVVILGQVGWIGLSAVYLSPQDPTPMVQYGQPDDDLKPLIRKLTRIGMAHGDTADVMFYGGHFSTELFRQPFPYYLAANGVNTSHTAFVRNLQDTRPPVVIVPADGSAGISGTASDIDGVLEGYWQSRKYAIVLEYPGSGVWVTVFVREDYVDVGGFTDADAAPDTAANRGTFFGAPTTARP